MESVVAIHNNMNEKTWRRVLEWEEMHCATCAQPRKLVRFVGRPDELSPKAALQYYLGVTVTFGIQFIIVSITVILHVSE